MTAIRAIAKIMNAHSM